MGKKDGGTYLHQGVAQCPFCGHRGKDAAIYPDGDCFRVHCGDCDAHGPLSSISEGDVKLAMMDAIKRWNHGRSASEPVNVTEIVEKPQPAEIRGRASFDEGDVY